jgi:hypothetical protein
MKEVAIAKQDFTENLPEAAELRRARCQVEKA